MESLEIYSDDEGRYLTNDFVQQLKSTDQRIIDDLIDTSNDPIVKRTLRLKSLMYRQEAVKKGEITIEPQESWYITRQIDLLKQEIGEDVLPQKIAEMIAINIINLCNYRNPIQTKKTMSGILSNKPNVSLSTYANKYITSNYQESLGDIFNDFAEKIQDYGDILEMWSLGKINIILPVLEIYSVEDQMNIDLLSSKLWGIIQQESQIAIDLSFMFSPDDNKHNLHNKPRIEKLIAYIQTSFTHIVQLNVSGNLSMLTERFGDDCLRIIRRQYLSFFYEEITEIRKYGQRTLKTLLNQIGLENMNLKSSSPEARDLIVENIAKLTDEISSLYTGEVKLELPKQAVYGLLNRIQIAKENNYLDQNSFWRVIEACFNNGIIGKNDDGSFKLPEGYSFDEESVNWIEEYFEKYH